MHRSGGLDIIEGRAIGTGGSPEQIERSGGGSQIAGRALGASLSAVVVQHKSGAPSLMFIGGGGLDKIDTIT